MGNYGMNDSTVDKAVLVYDAICWHMDSEEGRAPVIRELMVMTNIPSSAVMQRYLDVLRGWGWIDCTPGVSRTMSLTRPTECMVMRKAKRKAKARVA